MPTAPPAKPPRPRALTTRPSNSPLKASRSTPRIPMPSAPRRSPMPSSATSDRYYRPEYTTIIVVGDVKAKAVRAMVDKYWGEWKRGSYQPDIPAEPEQNGPRTGHVDWPSPTLPIVVVAFKAPAYNDATKETAALDALAYLAFSGTSDLYQKLVVQEQKADAISANAPGSVDA